MLTEDAYSFGNLSKKLLNKMWMLVKMPSSEIRKQCNISLEHIQTVFSTTLEFTLFFFKSLQYFLRSIHKVSSASHLLPIIVGNMYVHIPFEK